MLEGCLIPGSCFLFLCKRSFVYYSGFDFGMSDGVHRGDVTYIRILFGKAFFFLSLVPFQAKQKGYMYMGKTGFSNREV
jgi:hypothetical protein